MIRRVLNWVVPVLLGSFMVAGIAIAGELVDQGSPGKQGPWPVKVTSTSLTDGGTPVSSITTFTPPPQTTALTANGTACTAVGGASCTVIYTARNFLAWSNVTLSITNSDAADAITNVLVEWSPDNTNWEIWDSTTFAALAVSSTKSIAISGNSRYWLRVEARAVGNVNSATVTLTANDG